jgi:hypothetical protein
VQVKGLQVKLLYQNEIVLLRTTERHNADAASADVPLHVQSPDE